MPRHHDAAGRHHAGTVPAPVRPRHCVSLEDLAGAAGVSITTVSRVMSGQARHYRISEQTEARVRDLAREHQFVPNQIARGLRLKATRSIGLILPDISNPFFAAIAHQVTLGASQHGYSVILCDSLDTVEREVDSVALLQGRSVEGMVVCPSGPSGEHLMAVARRRLPIVLVDRYFPNLALPYVSSDNLAGARQATELLMNHGHRQIACLQGAKATATNELRVRGYAEALAHRGLAVDESLVLGDGFTEQSGYRSTKWLLTHRGGVTALLALSNVNALGALRALHEEGRSVPGDVSIVAFDDTPYSGFLATPLTTVAQANAEMGELAVKRLFDQLRCPGSPPVGGVLLPTNMVLRQSVKLR